MIREVEHGDHEGVIVEATVKGARDGGNTQVHIWVRFGQDTDSFWFVDKTLPLRDLLARSHAVA